ncbi:hypothetical protein EC968_010510, partial [Mortierella alpina]
GYDQINVCHAYRVTQLIRSHGSGGILMAPQHVFARVAQLLQGGFSLPPSLTYRFDMFSIWSKPDMDMSEAEVAALWCYVVIAVSGDRLNLKSGKVKHRGPEEH